jgi:hypothetical protein
MEDQVPRRLPTQQELRVLMDYDRKTGTLTWKARDISLFNDGGHSAEHNRDKWNARWAGKEALAAVKGDGYKHGAIDGIYYASHRVIWKWVTGDDPIEIDHIDGDRINNKWTNLRSVTRAANGRNMAKRKDNSSGATGVRYIAKGDLWQAYLYEGGVFVSCGSYKDKNDAIAARKRGDKRNDFHKNHGRN